MNIVIKWSMSTRTFLVSALPHSQRKCDGETKLENGGEKSVTNSAWVQNTAAAEIRRNTKSHSAVKKGCRGHPPKMMPQAVKYLQIQVFCIMSHSMEGLQEENKTKRLKTVTSGSVKCIWCKNDQDHQRQWKPEVRVWWCAAAWEQKVLGRQRHKWHLIGSTVNAWGYTKILTADVWQKRGLFQPGDVSKHTAKITRDSKEREKKRKNYVLYKYEAYLNPKDHCWDIFKNPRATQLLQQRAAEGTCLFFPPLSNCCFPSSCSACNRRLLCGKKISESNRCSAECNKYIGGLGTHSIFWMENIRSRWIINNDNIAELSPQPAEIFDVVASVKNTGFSEEPRLKHAPLV